jgi:methionyl-tRNA synthetase
MLLKAASFSIMLLTSVSALRGAFKTPMRCMNKFKQNTLLAETVAQDYFVTTPIYYVNGLPHLGHAYTTIIADVIARFSRKDGKNVYFLTGTDEHGQKVEQSAEANQKTPLQFADEVSDIFRTLCVSLNCSNDYFIRTTEPMHKTAVQEFWKDLEGKGQIYLGAYEGWYSIRDEAYYSETELVDGKAPTGAPVEWVKEESYFFRLSEYTDKLLAFYEANPDFIAPEGRRNEVISFVGQEGGLKDLSISRTTFKWGIPVPGNENHVVYVWLGILLISYLINSALVDLMLCTADALTNYISALGYPYQQKDDNKKKFWPASVHLVGKDILRFHAVFWPAFLMAAGLEPPKRIFAHGWWTRNGEKMSKSLGNVLDPFELVSKYGVDYLRYFLVSDIPIGNDGDFTDEAFITRVNSNLANDFGNLAQRVLSMIAKNCDNIVPAPGGEFTADDLAIFEASDAALDQMRTHIYTQSIHRACEVAINLARLGNKYIDTQAPWTLRKTDIPRMMTVLYVLTELVRRIAILLEPVMPAACNRMLDIINPPQDMRTFASLKSRIQPGAIIGVPVPIFPKIETEESLKKIKSPKV